MSRYFSSIKRYSWVILACVLLTSLIGYFVTRATPQVYQATSVLFVDSGAPGTTYQGGPTASDNITRALGYSAEILTLSTMQNVINADPQLKAHYKASDLLIDVVPTTSTTAPTITLLATAQKPAYDVLMANDVATTFANMIQTAAQQQLDSQRKNLEAQLTTYQQQETSLEGKLAATPNTDPHYAVYNVQLQDAIHSEQTVQGQLLLLPPTASLKGDVNVVQLATPSSVVASTKNIIILAATAGIGLLLGILIMFLLIFLDNRVNTEDQVTGKLGMAYLGSLSANKSIQDNGVVGSPQTLQEAADICANLHLTNTVGGQWQAPQGAVLLVTSNQAAEGRTTLATAIASTMAQSGKNVVIIDGNLRQPSTHLVFNLNSNVGLSNILRGTGREPIDDAMQRTKFPNLWLLAGGSAINNPVALLEQRFPYVLSQLRSKVDVVVIDGPPLLSGAEANVLAAQVDGVALVVDTKVDKVPLLMRAKQMLTTLTHTPVGIVMNRVPQRKHNQYYAAATPMPTVNINNGQLALPAYNRNGSEADGRQPSTFMIGGPNFIPSSPNRLSSLPSISTTPGRTTVSPLYSENNNSDRTQKPHSPSAQ